MATSAVDVPAQAKPRQGRLKTAFWLDMALFVSVAALQEVPFTGLVLHEWLGIGMIGMVFAHLLLSWSWIASQSRRFFARQSLRGRINYVLNLVFFVILTAVIFTGILISQKAVPLVAGTKAALDPEWRWDWIHNRFSTLVLIVAGLHVAINWDWVLAAAEKIFRRAQADTA